MHSVRALYSFVFREVLKRCTCIHTLTTLVSTMPHLFPHSKNIQHTPNKSRYGIARTKRQEVCFPTLWVFYFQPNVQGFVILSKPIVVSGRVTGSTPKIGDHVSSNDRTPKGRKICVLTKCSI